LLILRGPQPVRKKFKDGRPRPGMTNHAQRAAGQQIRLY
jgi:hypothetical protein